MNSYFAAVILTAMSAISPQQLQKDGIVRGFFQLTLVFQIFQFQRKFSDINRKIENFDQKFNTEGKIVNLAETSMQLSQEQSS